MKWFEKLMGSIDENEEKKDEGIENFTPLKEVIEPEPEPEETIEEVEPEVEPEPEIEVLEIEVVGDYEFDIKAREEYYNFQSQFYIEFSYKVNVKFLDESFDIESKFYMSEDRSDRGRMYVYYRHGLDEAYRYLDSIMEGDREELMENFRSSITREVREQIDKNYIEKLKKKYQENKSFEINMTFKIEKPKNM